LHSGATPFSRVLSRARECGFCDGDMVLVFSEKENGQSRDIGMGTAMQTASTPFRARPVFPIWLWRDGKRDINGRQSAWINRRWRTWNTRPATRFRGVENHAQGAIFIFILSHDCNALFRIQTVIGTVCHARHRSRPLRHSYTHRPSCFSSSSFLSSP
jgi:hypothetical protein